MLHIYSMCGVFYWPQHRTLTTRHPLALLKVDPKQSVMQPNLGIKRRMEVPNSQTTRGLVQDVSWLIEQWPQLTEGQWL